MDERGPRDRLPGYFERRGKRYQLKLENPHVARSTNFDLNEVKITPINDADIKLTAIFPYKCRFSPIKIRITRIDIVINPTESQ